ncbi:MAG: hypothetical protein ACYDG2_17425 [Ruminiclostridium sp.]
MRKVKRIKILVIIIMSAFLIQAGYVAYSMLGNNLFNKQIAAAENTASDSSIQPASTANLDSSAKGTQTKQAVNTDNQLKDETSLEISQDILDHIKASDADNYTKNVDNYKTLLKNLNVHIIFKNEIERLIKSSKELPDILTAYAFLNDSYGSMKDIEVLVKEKASGKKWVDIFKAYNKSNPEFVPRNFDSQYLEKLLETPGIDQEDIMIADRVSQNTKVAIEEVINKRIEGSNWRLINAQYEIVNGQEKSPHLSVTRSQLTKYTNQTKLSEKQVIEALTIASKQGISADSVLKSIKQGLSKEEIYSKAYEEKYY